MTVATLLFQFSDLLHFQYSYAKLVKVATLLHLEMSKLLQQKLPSHYKHSTQCLIYVGLFIVIDYHHESNSDPQISMYTFQCIGEALSNKGRCVQLHVYIESTRTFINILPVT